jgi:hypothetical protein
LKPSDIQIDGNNVNGDAGQIVEYVED